MHISPLAKWTAVVVVVASFVISGLTILSLARSGVLDGEPWEPVGTALAIFGAVTALIVGIAEADIGTHKTKRDAAPR
ncbi:hypothetical protein [Mumia sp. Pv 4-285]|uniref:hypothetical protein n=1 Tax=Mumia qirimensis TaxID=3234852 RepID=UPI00351CFAD3